MSSPWYHPEALLCLRAKVKISSRLMSIHRCVSHPLRTINATCYVQGFRTIEFPLNAGDPPTISFRARDPVITRPHIPQVFNHFLTLDVMLEQLVGFPGLLSIHV